MSIAVIVDTFPRWSERFIARELNELKRLGAVFTIYCLRAGDQDCERDPEFSDLIQHRVVLPACFIPSTARELGMDEAALRRKRLVEDELGITAFRQIGCANSLVKLLREHKHKTVYAHFASLPSTLGWLAAEAMHLPLVISAHARDVFVDAQLLGEKISRARHIFTCNQKAFGALLAAKAEPPAQCKITLMRHGLALEAFPFKARTAATSGRETKFLAAGRFVKKKGFDDLIRALAELVDISVSLTLLGDGSERKALERTMEKFGLSKRVRMPGSVQDAELARKFGESDALIVPSVNADDGDSDGVPNVVLEAFALGLPVIGTQAGSLGEVLDSTTGTVIPEREPAALARAMRGFAGNQTEAIAKTKAAREVIEERYDSRKNIEPLVRALGI